MKTKLLNYLVLIFVSLLFFSCDKDKQKAEEQAQKFLEVAYAGNENEMTNVCVDFVPLLKYNEKVNPSELKLDSVFTYDFSNAEKAKVSEINYKTKYGYNSGINKNGKLYVFHYSGKRNFRLDLFKDIKNYYFTLVPHNYFKPINNGKIASMSKDDVKVEMVIEASYNSDNMYKWALHKCLQAISIGVKVDHFVLMNGKSDSLTKYYPKIEGFLDHLSYPKRTDSSIIRVLLKQAPDGKKYIETQHVYRNDSLNTEVEKTLYFDIDKTDKTDDCIFNSHGYFYFYNLADGLRKEGVNIENNNELEALTDLEILNKLHSAEESLTELKAKKAARAKYENVGLVITDLQIKRGQDHEGNPTCGIEFTVFNPTQKEIKYVIASIIPVNGVGDVMGYTKNLRGIGPIASHSHGSFDFSDAYVDRNNIIDDFKGSFRVIYMDGSSKNVSITNGKADDNFSTSLWD